MSGTLAHSPSNVVIVVDPVVEGVVVAVDNAVEVPVEVAVEVAVVVAANGVQGTAPSPHVWGPIKGLQICVTGSRQAPTVSKTQMVGSQSG